MGGGMGGGMGGRMGGGMGGGMGKGSRHGGSSDQSLKLFVGKLSYDTTAGMFAHALWFRELGNQVAK